MADEVASFVRQMGKHVVETKKDAKQFMLTAARLIYEGVIRRTPVKTGQARDSWRISLGYPQYEFSLKYSDTNRASYQHGSDLTQDEAVRFNVVAATFRVGQAIYIANGQPYIEKLDNGSSQQAPMGMTRPTLQEVGLKLALMGGRISKVS